MDKNFLDKYKNLILIRPPFYNPDDKAKTRTIEDVYYDIEGYYLDDFNLTIEEMSTILKCSREWIQLNIVKNIKYIYISKKTFLLLKTACKKYNINDNILSNISRAKLYFSRHGFYNWLKNNINFEQQTIIIDLRNYAKNKSEFDSILHDLKQISNPSSDEYIKQELRLYESLNRNGKLLFNSNPCATKRTESEKIITEQKEIPLKFISIKELKIKLNINNNELIYRKLFSNGAIKYVINNSLIRYDEKCLEPNKFSYPLLIKYSDYIITRNNRKKY